MNGKKRAACLNKITHFGVAFNPNGVINGIAPFLSPAAQLNAGFTHFGGVKTGHVAAARRGDRRKQSRLGQTVGLFKLTEITPLSGNPFHKFSPGSAIIQRFGQDLLRFRRAAGLTNALV